jgi:tRNA A37 methylthiotransferase MiaB
MKAKFGEFTISTDIIVGFPSETEEEFQKTISLLDETKPDVVNLSKYSARPGTDAAEWDQIDAAEVKRRSKLIFEQISKISMESNQKWIGWKGKVLFDEQTEEGIKGRNFAYKPISVKNEVKVGQSHTVEITNVTVKRLVGKIAS